MGLCDEPPNGEMYNFVLRSGVMQAIRKCRKGEDVTWFYGKAYEPERKTAGYQYNPPEDLGGDISSWPKSPKSDVVKRYRAHCRALTSSSSSSSSEARSSSTSSEASSSSSSSSLASSSSSTSSLASSSSSSSSLASSSYSSSSEDCSSSSSLPGGTGKHARTSAHSEDAKGFATAFGKLLEYLAQVHLGVRVINQDPSFNIWTIPDNDRDRGIWWSRFIACDKSNIHGEGVQGAKCTVVDGYDLSESRTFLHRRLSRVASKTKSLRFSGYREELLDLIQANYATHLHRRSIDITAYLPATIHSSKEVITAQLAHDTYSELEKHLRQKGIEITAMDLRNADLRLNSGLQKYLVEQGVIAGAYLALNNCAQSMKYSSVPMLTHAEAIQAFPTPLIEASKTNRVSADQQFLALKRLGAESFLKGPIPVDQHDPGMNASRQVKIKMAKDKSRKDNMNAATDEEENEIESGVAGTKRKAHTLDIIPHWCAGADGPHTLNPAVLEELNSMVAPFTKHWDKKPPEHGGIYWEEKVPGVQGQWHTEGAHMKLFNRLVPQLRRWFASGQIFPGHPGCEISHVSILWSRKTELHIEEPRTAVSGVGVANLGKKKTHTHTHTLIHTHTHTNIHTHIY